MHAGSDEAAARCAETRRRRAGRRRLTIDGTIVVTAVAALVAVAFGAGGHPLRQEGAAKAFRSGGAIGYFGGGWLLWRLEVRERGK